MKPKLAIAHVVESRSDFLELRWPLVVEEIATLEWLRNDYEVVESEPLHSDDRIDEFMERVRQFGAEALMIHLPIWGDPVFSVRLAVKLRLPTLLAGNARPDTSSMVGLLGAGGALDQIGFSHTRVFDSHTESGCRKIVTFVRAASAVRRLQGMRLGLFGGRSLGIFTATADPAQWQQLFGVDIEYVDQLEIQRAAEAIPEEEAARHQDWLLSRTAGVQYNDRFSSKTLGCQVRSYLATRRLVQDKGFDFAGVKCQPELSDGYVTQCVAHMLMNGSQDADGTKPITVHACESDADGALTMQILHLLSGGQPAALLDIRWFNDGLWTLANCGAVPAHFCATTEDPSGLSQIRLEPHVFGKGGGGALPAVITPRQVTLARLCRRNREYWMAIVPGEVVEAAPEILQNITPAFPKAVVRSAAGEDFLNEFSSNHIHMSSGDLSGELVAFCELAGIPWKLWK